MITTILWIIFGLLVSIFGAVLVCAMILLLDKCPRIECGKRLIPTLSGYRCWHCAETRSAWAIIAEHLTPVAWRRSAVERVVRRKMAKKNPEQLVINVDGKPITGSSDE